MSSSRDSDPRPLLGLVLAVSAYTVTVHVKRWIDGLHGLLGGPGPLMAAAVLVGLGVVVLVVRWLACRRTLAGRVAVVLVPTDAFSPTPEAVLRFAAGLGRSRRMLRGSLDAAASAVRIKLDTDGDGRLRYTVSLPAHAGRALRTAVGSYGDHVEICQPDPEPHTEHTDGVVARAELVLARPSTEPLRSAGLDPDPLTGFAHALHFPTSATGGGAGVMIDLLPITGARGRRARRRLFRQAHHDQPDHDRLDGLLGDGQRHKTRSGPADLVMRRSAQRAVAAKLGEPEPLFAIQVLARAHAAIPGVATSRLGGLIAAFDVFGGENRFRASGLRIPGVLFLGSDVWWRRRRFDRRWHTGRFGPARRRLVTATEIAGLLKPPTANCHAANVLRSGGVISPPPPGLPTFSGQPSLLPLGRVSREGHQRTVGVPLSSTFFSYMAGRSRYGKTETAIGQFVHLARAGHGCFFLDPHQDAITKIKGYLTDHGLRERVVEIDLASHSRRQPGWNLFGVQGRSLERAEEQVDAVVDAFASALQWGERNARALNLVTQTAQALTELAHQLPAELAPTLFQIPTLLSDDQWRTQILPHVSAPTRQFFTDRFPRLPADAITPVTNLIDRLRVAPAVAGLLGSATCTYDVRQAMDRGQIVLACPGAGSARDRLVANFLVYDLLHAAKTRATLPAQARRPFYVFLDEVQIYDGASSGNLAALLEQTAKYGIRAFLFNQNPERLTPATLNAVTTNRSHLHTTALNAKGAALIAREWAGAVGPEVISRLDRYTYLASVTVGQQISPPFLIHGIPVDELFADAHHPDQLAGLEQAIDANTGRRPVTDTLAALAGHDRNIINYLREHRARKPRQAQDVAGGHGQRTIAEPS